MRSSIRSASAGCVRSIARPIPKLGRDVIDGLGKAGLEIPKEQPSVVAKNEKEV